MSVRTVLGSLTVFPLFLSSCAGTISTESTVLVRNEAYAIRVEYPERIQVGEKTNVLLHVFRGDVPADLAQEGRTLHVVIGDDQLKDIEHIIAPYSPAAGTYRIPHIFTEAGRYRVWAEIDNDGSADHHGEFSDLVSFTEFQTKGTGIDGLVHQAWGVPFRWGDFEIRMNPETTPSGKPVTLSVSAFRDGQSVPLIPAGDPANFALIGKDFGYFRHGHFSRGSQNSIILETMLPSPGEYLLWLEMLLLDDQDTALVPVSILMNVQ